MSGNDYVKENLSIQQLFETLNVLNSQKMDYVAQGSQISMNEGIVTLASLPYKLSPNEIFHQQLAEKLDIPFKYYRKMQTEFQGLLDTNVNEWLNRGSKRYFIRGYLNEGGLSTGRAFLSDQFKVIDNYSIMITLLTAIKKSGLNLKITRCDLTEKRMYIRLINESAEINAKEFLAKYRNPESGEQDPRINAGLIIGNSEVGWGALFAKPLLIMKVCSNGMVGAKEDQKRQVHMGQKLDDGEVNWSDTTKKLNTEVIQSMLEDYIGYYSSEVYLKKAVKTLTDLGSDRLLYPIEAVKNVSKEVSLTQKEQNDLIGYFMNSGDTSRAGIIHSLTFLAQKLDSDRRYDIESKTFDLLGNMAKYDQIKSGTQTSIN